MQISTEDAKDALANAFEWEPARLTEVFDRIAYRLHRNPRFRDLSISELDLLLADARREFERDIADFEWRLTQAFADAIAHDETGGVAA
jgi:hypothetical protein